MVVNLAEDSQWQMGLKPWSVKTGAFPQLRRAGERECEAQKGTDGRKNAGPVAWAEWRLGMAVRGGWPGGPIREESRMPGSQPWPHTQPFAPRARVPLPSTTHSQMKVPWGMVCRARTPQPILAVR